MITITKRTDQFVRAFEHATTEGLIRASVFYHDRCRRAVSKSNPRNRRTGQNDSPSKAGEPPRSRTGFGRDNIVWEFNGDTSRPATRIGVRENALYMYALENGFDAGGVFIKPQGRKALKIPWFGPVTMTQAKSGKEKAMQTGRTKKGLKKFQAIGKDGKTFTVYKDHGSGGGYFYFAKLTLIPRYHVYQRPWLMPTLRANMGRIAMLAAVGGKGAIG